MDDGAPTRVCSSCTQQFARYTCPKCLAQYCSLACYKVHNAACTEHFYGEQVGGALHGQRAGEGDAREMRAILERMRLRDATDPTDPADPGAADSDASDEGDERLQALLRRAEGGDISLEDLTQEERAHFEQLMANGTLSRLLEAEEPWWACVDPASLRRRADGQFVSAAPRAPAASGAVPPFSALAKRAPPAIFRWVVMDLLLAYVYVTRLFVCDMASDPADAASCLLQVSASLGVRGHAAFPSAAAAVASYAERCAHAHTQTSPGFVAGAAADACTVAEQPGFLSLALHDLCSSLEAGLAHAAKALRAAGGKERLGDLKRAGLKARFVLSWACSLSEEALVALCVDIRGALTEEGPRLLPAAERADSAAADGDRPRPRLEQGLRIHLHDNRPRSDDVSGP
mmetsp:Transcript_18996/g.63620  ORF Transcript_18996/g.63620 Transcript_18996/m.63620 type:complete len:402 (+) Transcript_18996:30-1235(+)